MIPFLNLRSQYRAIREEVRSAIDGVLDSHCFILGPALEGFEKAFASYLGSKYCVGVNSGTDAIRLALAAAGVGRDDRVVTVPNTAVPTVAAIRAAGAVPLFVDIAPGTYTMDPARLEECLSASSSPPKAVVPVHLYGHPAEMDPIKEVAARYGARVIEDACQAHGAEYKGKRVGAIGELGAFSFYPTKNLGAYGDAGAVVTDDAALYEKLRRLRNYGQKDRRHASEEGINSRLDEVQAAVLLVKLKFLDEWNEKRRALAGVYARGIDPERVTIPREAKWARHAYHLYVIRHRERDALREYLKENGVSTLIHYPVPVHLHEAYAFLGFPEGSFPASEEVAGEILSLPLYPELNPSDAEEVVSLINAFPG